MNLKLKPNQVVITHPDFRPNTITEKRDVIFSMMLEGEPTAAMGDCIAWMAAIQYIAENYNYVQGHLVVPKYFKELAGRFMERHRHWKVHTELATCPNKVQIKQQMEHPVNATAMHLVDLGFIYYLGTDSVPPESKLYPVLNLKGVKLPKQLRELRYVVMTPVIEANNRRMTAEAFNAVCDHLNQIGLTPVFLGKTGMERRSGSIDEKYDLSRGLDLINKTSLLEAAQIMDHAQMVIGIDNGLLHLAGCTSATILYGYTMVGPTHRRINRRHGWTVELYGDKAQLPCLFCQEKVRFFLHHDFRTCVYQENTPQCVKMLNKESWIANIDMVVKEDNERQRQSARAGNAEILGIPADAGGQALPT